MPKSPSCGFLRGHFGRCDATWSFPREKCHKRFCCITITVWSCCSAEIRSHQFIGDVQEETE